jgi:hypothetical protein
MPAQGRTSLLLSGKIVFSCNKSSAYSSGKKQDSTKRLFISTYNCIRHLWEYQS